MYENARFEKRSLLKCSAIFAIIEFSTSYLTVYKLYRQLK